MRDGVLFDGPLTPHKGAAGSEFEWCPVFPGAHWCGFKSGRCRPSSAGSGPEDAGPHPGSNDGPYRPACVIASGGKPGQPFSFRRVTGAMNDAADATLHAAVSRAGGSGAKGGSPASRFATASRLACSTEGRPGAFRDRPAAGAPSRIGAAAWASCSERGSSRPSRARSAAPSEETHLMLCNAVLRHFCR